MTQPTIRPQNPHFSSGPCAKIPGFTLEMLSDAPLGRSHRAKIGKSKLEQCIQLSKQLLNLPAGYELGIVAGSDTGAFEMALWNLLGERGVDVLAWEAFSTDWMKDIKDQLKLTDARYYTAPYGALPDLTQVDSQTRDIVFAWNGTTSGVRVPNADWIADDRQGLVFCDATSAVFAMDLPWHKLDVITYSWQKAMGGEAAHGILILSPRAIERLNRYQPAWPLPKLFQLTKKGQFAKEIFEGATINTPSMLCVEDALVSLQWMQQQGGLSAMQQRAQANFAAVAAWVANTPWVDFLATDPATRSTTSICLTFTAPEVTSLADDAQQAFAKTITSLLEKQGVAYDIGAYRTAPVGLRIWGGSTVDVADIQALLPWIDWAYGEALRSLKQAA